MAGCLRLNVNLVRASTDRVTDHHFRINEQYCFTTVTTRMVDCGCAMSVPQEKTFYTVECNGRTYELEADYVREVNCDSPQEEPGTFVQDSLASISDPKSYHELRPDTRNDDLARRQMRRAATFDLRRNR